jgi:hypothetical protein
VKLPTIGCGRIATFYPEAQLIPNVRGALLAALFTLVPTRLAGQEENLLPKSGPDVRALYTARHALQTLSGNLSDPLLEVTSPDASKLQLLSNAASSGGDYLRATADLLSIYDNLQCDIDRAIVKPLLEDRLRLHSRLLEIDAEKAAIPLGFANQPATTKRALKLRDDLLAAKNKVDAIAASLK